MFFAGHIRFGDSGRNNNQVALMVDGFRVTTGVVFVVCVMASLLPLHAGEGVTSMDSVSTGSG